MMSITSYSFYALSAVTLLLYYAVPKRFRWQALCAATLVFLFSSGTFPAGALAVGMVLWAWGAGFLLMRLQGSPRPARAVVALSVAGLAAALFFCKEQQFFIGTARLLSGGALKLHRVRAAGFLTPLGISYFTLTLISYVCGVYWNSFEAEKNPLRLLTYGLFFPSLTSGPILRYNESAPEILAGKDFDYAGFCFGLQRIAWGFFKKLVISERLAVMVNAVYGDYSCGGVCILLAACAFSLQLYTDFSGCIDIALGVSGLFGIRLPENFDLPFASRSLAEFWRRWHITLGVWLKEFILYPVLKSDLFQAIGKQCKKKFGKKTGKKIPTWIGLAVSWFLIGLWHGGEYHYIFGVGLFMGAVIILSEILEPVFSKMKKVLKINEEGAGWILFQRIRTFLLFSFGLSFFRAPSLTEGFRMWRAAFSDFNLQILADGTLLEGISFRDLAVFAASMLVLFVSGVIRLKKKESLRVLISRQNVAVRWALYIALVWSIVVFGVYGPGYNAAAFIYEQF